MLWPSLDSDFYIAFGRLYISRGLRRAFTITAGVEEPQVAVPEAVEPVEEAE